MINIFQISEYLGTNIVVPSNNNISSGILYDLAKEIGRDIDKKLLADHEAGFPNEGEYIGRMDS